MVYARCVGTSYCENNCPYSARTFNFFDHPRPPPASLGLNPDVTVRERGVTEKCTLCVQRIRAGEEQAKFEGRPIRDGEIVSACAATCPARAIVFGDLKDPASEASRCAADGRAYQLLEELNTQPGVFYLARRRGQGGHVTDANPARPRWPRPSRIEHDTSPRMATTCWHYWLGLLGARLPDRPSAVGLCRPDAETRNGHHRASTGR